MKRVLLVVLLLLLAVNIASAQEPVTLRLWAHQEGAFNEGTQALIDAYMAANPHVTI